MGEALGRTFGARGKTVQISTPTIEGRSRIAAAYERTDQRRFYEMRIEKMAVDSGYATQDVYQWARRHTAGSRRGGS